MTKVNKTTQALSLADHAQEIYENLVLSYESDSLISANLITVTVDTEDKPFKICAVVTMNDTVETVKDRLDCEFNSVYDEIQGMERWEADNYEHASVTQGYSFDILTC